MSANLKMRKVVVAIFVVATVYLASFVVLAWMDATGTIIVKLNDVAYRPLKIVYTPARIIFGKTPIYSWITNKLPQQVEKRN